MGEFQRPEERELLLEAARRANWDALHGPEHLRRGEFNPSPVHTSVPQNQEQATEKSIPADQNSETNGAA